MPAAKPANRPVLLLVAMWALLAFSFAGALTLVHLKSGAWRIALKEPQKIGTIEVRLPAGWDVSYSRRGASEFIDVVESDPPGRRLSIRATDTDLPISPMEFLLNSNLDRLMALEPEDVRLVEDLEVTGGKGFIVHPVKGAAIAVITFRDGRAVTIQFSSKSGSAANDDAIIYHVANSLRMGEREPVTPTKIGTGRDI